MAAPEGGGFVDLPRVAELDSAAATQITAASLARLIVVAGPAGCGKTTLLTSLYERFLRAPTLADYCFAGSETLIGFEQRCHPGRRASGRSAAGTEPTRMTQPLPMLHLRVRRADLSAPARDLLFVDIDGTTFQHAKDSTEACRRLGMLSRSDRVVIGLDGSALLDPTHRFAAAAAVRDFLRRACDAEMLGQSSRIDVVVTKWDAVEALELEQRSVATATLDRLSRQLRDDFSTRVAVLRFGRVAARPVPGRGLDAGFGLADLVPAWIEEAGFRQSRTPGAPPEVHREIDRFGGRLMTAGR